MGNTAIAGAPDFTGTSNATYYAGSFVAARAFGPNSVGVEFETLRGSGDLTTLTTNDQMIDRARSTSSISQTRLTAGYSHDFAGGAKLGVFYRYGFAAADDLTQSHTVNGDPASLFATRTFGHTVDVGGRLRGPLTRRLTYGVAALWTGVSLGGNSGMGQSYRAARTSLAAGIGYALNRRTMLSVDVTGGAASGGHFASFHTAVQTNVTRHLFATASYLNLRQCPGMEIYPVAYPIGSHFSDFGAGWRFTPDLFAQYVYSTDYGFSAPSHTLMLRYTFRLKGE